MEKMALLFPGGGTQYVGMGKRLCQEFGIARETFEEANDLLATDLARLCFEGNLEELSAMENSQPAIFTVGVAAYRVYAREFGAVPDYAAGHSLGEYTALTCAGVFRFSDALLLVRRRGTLLQEAGVHSNGTMMAVNKVPASVVEETIREVDPGEAHLYVAVYNSPLQHVVSGERRQIAQLSGRLERRGAEINILNINTPSHCPLILPAARSFETELLKYPPQPFNWPVIANLTGKPYEDQREVAGVLVRHMYQPVQWMHTLRYLYEEGVTRLLDVGPLAVLKNLCNYALPPGHSIRSYALDVHEDLALLRSENQEMLPDRQGFVRACLAIVASTPNYNPVHDPSKYALAVSEPYKKLKQLCEETNSGLSTNRSLHDAYALLRRILDFKQVPEPEQRRRLDRARSEHRVEDLLPQPVQ